MTNETTAKDSVIEKIEKLLRLSESSNEHEAQVALKKARELMLKHHIAENDLQGATYADKVEWKIVPIEYSWQLSIYSEVCRNMRCDCYLRSTRNAKYKISRNLHIVGFHVDLECVVIMGNYLSDVCKNGLTRERQRVREQFYDADTSGLAAYYRRGFVSGVKSAFDEQNKENDKYAVMCIKPVEVEDEINKISGIKSINVLQIKQQNRHGQEVYTSGFESGYASGHRNCLE